MIFWYCSLVQSYCSTILFFFSFSLFWGCFEVIILVGAIWREDIFIHYTFFKNQSIIFSISFLSARQTWHFASNSETHSTPPNISYSPDLGNWEWGALGVEESPRRQKCTPRRITPKNCNRMEFPQLDWTLFRASDSFLPSIVFSVEGNVYNCYPMLSHYCILGADHLSSNFTNPQIGRTFTPE